MDSPATNFKTIDTLISSLNVEYILQFNGNDFGSVQPGSGRGEYRYYFSYTIDLNHDGQIFIGDYIQDFDKSPFINYTHTESGERIIDLYTKKVTEGNCYAF